MQTEILLVRHGEPSLQQALLGSTDSPLSELGWLQMQQQLEHLQVKHKDIDLLVSSPLARCAAFAQDFASESKLDLQIVADWRECHFGEWDGISYQDLYNNNQQAMTRFIADPADNTPPGGESLAKFTKRIETVLLKLISEHSGKKIVVFTHAGVIRNLVAWCLKMDYSQGMQFRRFAVDYASATQLSIYQDDELYPQLQSLNDRPQIMMTKAQEAELDD